MIRSRSKRSPSFAWLLPLALAASQPALALQVVDARDGETAFAKVSRKEVTRIAVERGRIRKVTGNAGEFVLEKDDEKGQVFIRPVSSDSTKPINLFVSTERSTIGLLLQPVDTPSDAIVIREARDTPAGPARIGNQFTEVARAVSTAKKQATPAALDGVIDNDRDAGRDGAAALRQAARETEPPGAFDARAIRDLPKAAPTDPKGLRRTIRRSELRQIVPLADSTIYELERRGEFPQRFYLTARCVVWDLSEVMAWLQSRRQAGSNGVKKAAVPDVRRTMRRTVGAKG